MTKILTLFLLLNINLFSQTNICEKSCDKSIYKGFQICNFENQDCKSKMFTQGAYFISSFKELKYYLNTFKKQTYLETKDGKIIDIDFEQYNLILFSGSVGGSPPKKFNCFRKGDQYIFTLNIIYNGVKLLSNLFINYYCIIPKNVKKENVRFLYCEK